MNWRKLVLICMPFTSIFILSACAQTSKNYSSPAGYDLNKGEQIFVPEALHELSGIAFPEESSKLIFAHEDEHGFVYYFEPGSKNYKKIKFGSKGDYEGIAIGNGYIIVLESKGTVYTFPYSDILQKEAMQVKIGKQLIPKAEYESIAVSTTDSLLYVLCKKCSVDKATDSVTGYILKLSKDGEVSNTGEFKIDEKQIEHFSSLKGRRFRPSDLTKNKQTNHWFILSSINKMLVVADDKWDVQGVYPLDPVLFNQPEAIAFDEGGNLYIGNEAGTQSSKGTLIKFKLN